MHVRFSIIGGHVPCPGCLPKSTPMSKTVTDVNRNRNLKILKRYSKAKRTSLFTSAATNQWGFQRGVKRSSGPISRVPGGDRVAVRVGVVELGRGMIRWVRA